MEMEELYAVFIALREMQGWELKDNGQWLEPEWMREIERNKREAKSRTQ